MSRLILLSLCMSAYVFVSAVVWMPVRFRLKVMLGVLCFGIGSKYLLYKYFGASTFAPVLPVPVLLIAESLYTGLLFACMLLLLRDVLALILLGLRTGLNSSWRLPYSRNMQSAVLIVVALTGGAWGTLQAVRVPDVRTTEILIPNLPAALDGFSIVQLSDMHVGALVRKPWVEAVVNKVQALNPDLIAITGDTNDGMPEALADDMAPLRDLRADYGVFGVKGNHEYYFDIPGWERHLRELGITLLRNEHRALDVHGTQLIVAGVDDDVAVRFGERGPDVQAAFENAPEGIRLLLAHQPKNARHNAPFADVQLSGHTHGGMLLFLQPLIAFFNEGFVEGLYTVDAMQMYVAPGAAQWAGFAARVGVPSEISRLVLRRMQ